MLKRALVVCLLLVSGAGASPERGRIIPLDSGDSARYPPAREQCWAHYAPPYNAAGQSQPTMDCLDPSRRIIRNQVIEVIMQSHLIEVIHFDKHGHTRILFTTRR
jgi:hypothetical protein